MNWIDQELAVMGRNAALRSLRVSGIVPGFPGYLLREGASRPLLNLSANDYLGLSQHPAIVEAMQAALQREGAGSAASRLVTGNRPAYSELEQAVAEWQGCEAALVFANGYMANTGVIRAIAGRDDVVFSDRLNHASIVDGILLSRAKLVRYPHNDVEQLATLLHKHRDRRRKLIVTDSLFSMDGDRANLQALVRLKREHGAMLMVDEAHSGGVYGRKGEGLCHELELQEHVDIHMGTFSKAFGVYGAYLCGSRTMIEFLVNQARPLIYSTALPPFLPAGLAQALSLVQQEHWRREKLYASARRFRAALSEAGFRVGLGDSAIVPVIVGGNETALQFSELLEERGIAAVAIRPPTVPEGTARIRFTLSAAHTEKDLHDAAERIREVGLALGVLAS